MSETKIEITEQMRTHLGVYFAAAKSTTDPFSAMLNTRNAFDLVLACCDIEGQHTYDERLDLCQGKLGEIFILETHAPENRMKILWFCSEILKIITPLVYQYATFGTDSITTEKLSGRT
jgi:hypothetical protein